jgi:predicted transcriptional regulator
MSILWITNSLQTSTKGVEFMQIEREQLHAQLKVLGMRYTWEIIANIKNGSKYMKQIANETEIPYTTVQKRISDMEQAGIVRIYNDVDRKTGKAIKKVRLSRFRINVDPYFIEKMVSDND